MLDLVLAVLLGAIIMLQKVFGERNYVSFIQYTIMDLTVTKPVQECWLLAATRRTRKKEGKGEEVDLHDKDCSTLIPFKSTRTRKREEQKKYVLNEITLIIRYILYC